ncbi:cysteine peptidase family C39 domain-containing protein [Bradyrhizobium sp.]|uniref:cysteine peptidase family C39 domain-containing protein n=1 Tax=Bradyrhizobium sp. TaxID=376 RepID=UPI003C717A78
MANGATPVILQMEAAECGAVCLAMVLASHGKHVALEVMRERCNTSRDGLNAAQIKKAAETFGLDVKSLRCEPEDLGRLPTPMIVHWNFDHYVVLEKVTGDRFHLVDPAIGRRTVDRRTFGRSFTGVVLIFEPGERFERSGRRPSVLRTLLEEARRSPDAMASVGLAGIAAILPGIALSGAIGLFVDHVAGNGQTEWGAPLILGLVCLMAVQALLAILSGRIGAAFRAKIAVHIAARGFWHALFLPLGFFQQRNVGDLIARLRLGADVGGTVAGPLANVLPNIVEVAIYLAVLLLFNPLISLTAASIAAVNCGALFLLTLRIGEANRAQQVVEGSAAGIATAGFAVLAAYRMHGREDLLKARIIAAEDRALDAEQRMGWLTSLAGLGPLASGLVLNAAALMICAWLVMEGDLSLGGLVSVQTLVGLLAAPVAALAADLTSLQRAAGAVMRVGDILDNPTEASMAPERIRQCPPAIEGRLSLRGVGHDFAGGANLFHDIDLEVAPGEMVALVGVSGSGKSTLARIAAGLAPATRGSVLLDGIPIGDWPCDALRRTVQYVPQNSAVFTGTIEQNVSVWDEAIDGGTVAEAVAAVGLESRFARSAAGLSARIASASAALSGGEIQRLALARALARRPRLLILDETTSALDTISEKAVIALLRRTGTAVLIVTHRAGTAVRCDRTYALQGGRLLLQASKAEFGRGAPKARPSRAPIPLRDAV